MTWVDVLSLIVGVLGFAWGMRFYLELRKWAHLMKYGRIVVAYKNKVKLNAPLQEWALWCKMAEDDKSANGRVVYTLGGTRLAVLRKSFVPDPPVIRVFKAIRDRVKQVKITPHMGGWKAEDHTRPVEEHVV